jgi:spore coat polysaccharide biosynthesis protein SpsF
MSNVVCIVQARVGSTRLPGKVMLKLCNYTVLYHVLNRVKQSRKIDKIIVATTQNEKDSVIVGEAVFSGVEYYRGCEDDVLDRYYQAAYNSNATEIVRITSDCPLIDPNIIDHTIDMYFKENKNKKYDYACNFISRRYPRGLDVEIFSKEALSKAHKNAKQKHEREHVTPYIYKNPELFTLLSIENASDESKYRWTLDVEEDYQLLNEIYEYFWKRNIFFGKDEVINYLKNNVDLLDINSKIKQKK